MKLIKSNQFLTTEKTTSSFAQNNFSNMSIGELINHQQEIKSSIGLYLFEANNNQFCLLLSNDKNLAKKLSINPKADIYTQDLFPIDYNTISIAEILFYDKDDVVFINNKGVNYYFMIAKGVDAENTLTFIDIYKNKSYAMQKSWQRRKNMPN